MLNNPVNYIDPSGHSYVNFDNSVECPIEQCGLNPYESENGEYQGEDLYENYSYEEVTMMQLFWMDTRGRDAALREGLYNELNLIARHEYDECGLWCTSFSHGGQLYFETGLDPDVLAGFAATVSGGLARGSKDESSGLPNNHSYIRLASPEDLMAMGRSGDQPNVRILDGGKVNAEAVFDELTVGYIGERAIPGGGMVRQMPGDAYITYRPQTSSRSNYAPGLYFNFPETGYFKWKFE